MITHRLMHLCCKGNVVSVITKNYGFSVCLGFSLILGGGLLLEELFETAASLRILCKATFQIVRFCHWLSLLATKYLTALVGLHAFLCDLGWSSSCSLCCV